MSWFRRLWNRLCAWLARHGLLPRAGIFYIGGSDSLPPPLSRDVEAQMIARLDEGDFEVRQILIEHNLRLVAYIARRFDNTGINIEALNVPSPVRVSRSPSRSDCTVTRIMASTALRASIFEMFASRAMASTNCALFMVSCVKKLTSRF